MTKETQFIEFFWKLFISAKYDTPAKLKKVQTSSSSSCRMLCKFSQRVSLFSVAVSSFCIEKEWNKCKFQSNIILTKWMQPHCNYIFKMSRHFFCTVYHLSNIINQYRLISFSLSKRTNCWHKLEREYRPLQRHAFRRIWGKNQEKVDIKMSFVHFWNKNRIIRNEISCH
jgi:hypothetical protein